MVHTAVHHLFYFNFRYSAQRVAFFMVGAHTSCDFALRARAMKGQTGRGCRPQSNKPFAATLVNHIYDKGSPLLILIKNVVHISG
jgi:hypothetical protein